MKMSIFSRKTNAPTPRRRLSDNDGDYQQERLAEDGSYSFRRNRTITGSRSAQVSSANENDARLQSPRAAAHSLRKQRRSLASILVASTIVAGVVFWVLYQLIASVSIGLYGQVTSLDSEDEVKYQHLVNDYLGRHPLQRLRINFNESQLTQYMHQRGATEVETIVSIQPTSLGESQIVIKMREPLAVWTIDGTQRYVDDSGTIFSKSFYGRPDVRIIDESGIQHANNGSEAVASGRFLSFIGQSVGQFKRYKLAPKAVVIPPDTTRQTQIELPSGVRIKLSVDRPAGEQAEDASRAVSYLTSHSVAAQYVDVRVSGKAYYRVK